MKSRITKKSLGSALILAVVLSSLLAIVGVLFVLAARVNSMATSAVEEDKDLDLAVESVVADISQQLVLDVPGLFDPNSIPFGNQEYYDFPDANNLWLADIEPYFSQSDGKYYWRQISDITGYITQRSWSSQNIEITDDPNDNLFHAVRDEHEIIGVLDGDLLDQLADADGDGIADSKWIELNDIDSSKGRPIYAAVRVIDNGAMLNVNTAFKFNSTDPNMAEQDIDGSSQMQINLMDLACRPFFYNPGPSEEDQLLADRTNTNFFINPLDLGSYKQSYIWNFDKPTGWYTPFDISDELEMRYRFLINHKEIDTRLENWGGEFRSGTLMTPVTSGGEELNKWYLRAYGGYRVDPNGVYRFDPNYAYAYRHIATTYNMDRIINPVGYNFNHGKMVNINTAEPNLLYDAFYRSLVDREPNLLKVEQLAGQLTANIIDLRDEDSEITVFRRNPALDTYYGLEAQPFISDLAFKISESGANINSANYFAVELYNPFSVDVPLESYRLVLRNQDRTKERIVNFDVNDIISENSRFIITNSSSASSIFGISFFRSKIQDSNLVLAEYQSLGTDPPTFDMNDRYDIFLIRETADVNIYLDEQVTADNWFDWEDVKGSPQCYCRSDDNLNVIYQDMSLSENNFETLTHGNGLPGPRKNYNFVNTISPYFGFRNIGEIDRVLSIGPSDDPNDMLGVQLAMQPPEWQVRIDPNYPAFENIFRYITVIDPTMHGWPPDETRIKGRININTAPWFVMYQLPWIRPIPLLGSQPQIVAQDIVNDRIRRGAFKSIANLVRVPEMGFYAHDSNDLLTWPDLTPGDGAIDDLEERDIIFTRVSNLVTVRSDVFTAYILVRIGADGPQQRAVAILDRSKVKSPGDKVRIIALHPVPDPR